MHTQKLNYAELKGRALGLNTKSTAYQLCDNDLTSLIFNLSICKSVPIFAL